MKHNFYSYASKLVRAPLGSCRIYLPRYKYGSQFSNQFRELPACSFSFSNSAAAELVEDCKGSPTLLRRQGVRNCAIIAHVDHGKTTLVDKLLFSASMAEQDGVSSPAVDRLMDSGDLEKERGITIKSKVTRVSYSNTVLNLVDTPGHSDFAGEVDRILSLVDGSLLLVDALEGPMTQTKYVLGRALAAGLKPIVVLNKCDRPEAISKIDSGETEESIQQLFAHLGASEEQMNYQTFYSSARDGWVTGDPLEALEIAETGRIEETRGMAPLLDSIIRDIPEPLVQCYDTSKTYKEVSQPPEVFLADKFSMAAVTVGYDQFLGRLCTGRVNSGSIAVKDAVAFLKQSELNEESPISSVAGVTGIFVYKGIHRVELNEPAVAGDIVTIAGVPDEIAVGDTLTKKDNPVPAPIPTPPLAPPTLCMEFGANTGPLSGKDGTILSSAKVRERLQYETDNNVTLKAEKSESDPEKTTMYARGELQLGILIEEMRREGFELLISPPKVLTTFDANTKEELEPFEEVTVDVDSEFSGSVVSALTGDRKGTLLEMKENQSGGKSRLIFEVPSRGLLGFSTEVASMTRGSAVVTHLYIEDRPYAGTLGLAMKRGKLVSNASGKASAYALGSLAARGSLFVEPGDEVYSGMVIGESSRGGVDMEVNPVRAKELTNMRTQAKDEKVQLPPATKLSLEELIGYMGEDEQIEVTPKNIRLRKQELDSGARERAARNKAKAIRSMKSSK